MDGPTCPACGSPTAAGFRRCGACGARLAGTTDVEEIQRFATVVTSDLKGSTALGERLDPETLRQVLTLYFDEMQAVFRSHGGTIEKIIGDAIVAVFGLPVRHEDDALRAVEAAAESQRVLASLNDRLEQAWGVRLVARTGIATGIVVFGEASAGQHVLTGDTMQASSAMEQHAPPLEVLIAESTYELVRDVVDIEPAEPVTPKGTTTSVGAYRLVSVAPRPEAGQGHADAAGTGLLLCPACGQENPDTFRMCGMCGSTLASAAGFRESRKTVSIVFADPKPTMLNGERPSAEALRDVMSRYFEVMKDALEQHGGTVEKFIGDAVMAVFGLPVRHEDDALRAVRGAAAMQAAMPALNERFRERWGLELRNHIGVNSGEVIAGDASLGQRLVTGDAVNTAARLEQAAGPHEVILGNLTYRLARDQIEVEPIAPLALKGKAEPVPAYRLLRVAQRSSERAAPTTPFVGREAEMARLDDTLLEVEATRACQLVTVIGDAGVGKSRLIREFATRASARDRAQVFRGRCLPYGDGVTFWPIYEIVRAAAGISDEDPHDIALAKIGEITRRATTRADDAGAIIDRVGAAIGLSDTQFAGPELFWGIRKLLEAIASRRPLVAIVDDLHVAAPTFLELIDHLLDTVHGSPILLLTTARRELLESRTEWAEGHESEAVTLEPLSADDSEAIIGQLLGGLHASVRQRIVAAAEGNPLYVEQIAAMLVETGAIRLEGSQWVAAVASGELDIPPTIQALVAARLDALRDEERQVIDPASVIGLGFAVDAVSHLVAPTVAPDVPDRLKALTSKQFVRPTVSEEDFYRFGHAVIKDSAYRSLLKRTRAELHERFVDWAEPVNRERGRALEFEEILGYHLEQAYQYRSELGAIDPAAHALGRRAAEKLAGAGRRALGRGDMPAAANLLGRAAALLPTDDEERIALLPELAEALMELGDLKRAAEVVAECAELSAQVGVPHLAARASLIRLGIEMYASGFANGTELAMADARAAIETLEASGDSAGLARAWRVVATVHDIAGRQEEATIAAQQMIDYAAAANDRRLIGRAAAGLASVLLRGPRPVDEVRRACDELLRQVEGDRKAEAIISGVMAQLHAMTGDFETARRLYRHGQAVMADLGQSVTGAATSLESSRVEVLADDLEAAERELRRDDEALAAVGEQYFRSTIAGLLANVLLTRGSLPEANRFATLGAQLAGSDDIWSQVLWRTARARLDADAGRVEEAVLLAREAIDLADSTLDIELAGDARTTLADVLETSGRADATEPPLREALERYEAKGDLVLAERIRQRLVATP